MKRNLLTIYLTAVLSLLLLVSCNNKEEKKTVLNFSVKIENPNGDSLFIENVLTGDRIRAFYLENGELKKDTIQIPMGYYRLDDGTETTLCFLKPEYDLHLTLNTMEFDESIKYSGTGENENNYLAAKYLLEESFQDINYYGYYASLNESGFLNFADSIYNLKLQLFNDHKDGFDKDFTKLEYEKLHIQYLTKIANYESMHGFITEDQGFRTSDNFPNPFENIELNDEQLILIPGYIHFVKLFIQKKTRKQWENNKDDPYYNFYIDITDSEIQNAKIKEEVAYYIYPDGLKYAEDKDYFYNKLKEMITNPEYLEPIEETYSQLQKIKPGAVSPTFELYDIDSNLVKLDDFRGKLVYIDIWATWCAPCISEIPYLDELQTEFKNENIVFISICQNDDKERWKATVLSNELQGIHLFVDDVENEFLSDYLVSGIPRFILIDENGCIIDSEAFRPSNPSLKEQLKELL